MGILNKIKDFFSSEKEKKQAIIEKVKISELDSWITIQKSEINSKKKQIKQEFDEKKHAFLEKIKQGIVKLRDVDLQKYKVDEKTRNIVKQGILTYIMHLNSFLENIKKINGDIEENIIFLDKEFAKFEKNSIQSYHKTTIIIGEEIGKIVENISDFLKYIRKLQEENSDLFKKREFLDKIQKQHENLNEKNEIEKQILNSLENIKNNLSECKKNKQKADVNFEEFKKSKEYAEEIEKQENISQTQKQLDEEIFKFKQDMNLKFLMKFFHHDNKKREIIEKYEGNLLSSFSEDSDLKIIDVVNYVLDTCQNYPDNLKKINKQRIQKILEKSFKLDKDNKDFKKSSLKYLENIKTVENNIFDLNKEADDFRNKKNKLNEKQREIIKSISKEFENFDNNLKFVF